MKYLEITSETNKLSEQRDSISTLQITINKDNPTTGDRLVTDADERLEELITSGELSGGKLIKINGRTPLPVAYTILHKIAHLYSAIAVKDIRLGYIVVVSTNPKYHLGDRIDDNNEVVSRLKDSNEEPSFLIDQKEEDTLNISFNSRIRATGDLLVRDAAVRLDELAASGRLTGKLLKIYGKASLLVSYVIASKILHAYGAIAVFEPKDGDEGLDRYIITVSHSPDYRVGDTFDLKSAQERSQNNIKIALCGPPNTGKTVFRDGLKKAIQQNVNAPADWLYVISGCPDGDYNWMTEVDSDLAKQLKQQYKATKFTRKFAHRKSQEIKSVSNPLLLFDVGGRITPENKEIMAGATHGVILVPTGGVITKLKGFWQQYRWQKFCRKLNVKAIAIIYSDYYGKKDRVYSNTSIFKGVVHYLERGKDSSSRPTIQALARLIINLVESNSPQINCE